MTEASNSADVSINCLYRVLKPSNSSSNSLRTSSNDSVLASCCCSSTNKLAFCLLVNSMAASSPPFFCNSLSNRSMLLVKWVIFFRRMVNSSSFFNKSFCMFSTSDSTRVMLLLKSTFCPFNNTNCSSLASMALSRKLIIMFSLKLRADKHTSSVSGFMF